MPLPGRLAVFICAVVLGACQPAPRPTLGPPPPPIDSLGQLHRDLDSALAAPELAHSYWGVLVRSLKTDETLYSVNARKLMMPGSAMKIVTLAAAAERLEWDYTYETRLLTIGSIDGGVLNGDLLVVGSGDPSIVERDGVASRLFDSWADTLKAAGVRTIDGRIIGDDNAFDDDGLGAGWAWDDLDKGFATPVGALQFNENSARLTIAPGSTPGSPTDVTVAPDGTGLVIHNQVTTAAAGTTPAVESRRLPGSARLELRGSIPIDGGPASRPVSVDNPTLFFVTALRTALMAHGIDVRGPAVDVDDVTDAASRAASVPVASHRSSTLATLATTLMKASQNLYAETLLKTVGASVGTPTIKAGTATARTALLAWHVEPSGLIQVDGSGLSRYNYVTPEALVTILTHVDRDDRLRAPFEAALPVAGRDGTLANRMQGTPAEANARAKTGTLANVRALAGYVATSDGEPLVFSILANNFETDPDAVVRTIDGLVVRLARFRR